jgi:hypothetical protein
MRQAFIEPSLRADIPCCAAGLHQDRLMSCNSDCFSQRPVQPREPTEALVVLLNL